MIYVAIVITAFLALLFLGAGMRIVQNVELENRMTEAEIESSRRYQAMMSDRVEQVRRYRHDADALLRAIERAANDDVDPDRAGAPVGLQSPDDAGALDEARFPLSHAALELQRHRCEQAGLPFTCDIEAAAFEDSAVCGIDDSDLCLVLQNLLDNAYEASMAMGEEPAASDERAISLRIGGELAGGLRIEVANRTAGESLPAFRTGKANPELHGVGLQVVEDIARKHGGELVPTFDSGTRILTMMVRLKP